MMDTDRMERTETFTYGELTVWVECIGPQVQPWGGLECYGYRVNVKPGEFETKFYGSNMDYVNGVRDHEGAAKGVLRELWDASNDPDEFYSLATEDGERGSYESAFERAKGVMALIETAERLSVELDAISDVFEDE